MTPSRADIVSTLKARPSDMWEEDSMACDPDICTHCARHVDACECLLVDCGHLLNPEQDDDPPCEQCDRCQDCCQCPDNNFKAGLRGE